MKSCIGAVCGALVGLTCAALLLWFSPGFAVPFPAAWVGICLFMAVSTTSLAVLGYHIQHRICPIKP